MPESQDPPQTLQDRVKAAMEERRESREQDPLRQIRAKVAKELKKP